MQMLDAVTLNKVASVLADLLHSQQYGSYPYNGSFPQLITPKSGHSFALGAPIASSVASNIPGGYRVIMTDNASTTAYTRYADTIVGLPDTEYPFPAMSSVGLPAGTYVLQVRKQSPTSLDNVHTIRISIGMPAVVLECDATVAAKPAPTAKISAAKAAV